MLALPLTARLLAAVPDDCRLVLVGDPDQLRSIEVGTVLADLVAAGAAGRRARRSCRPPRHGSTAPATDSPIGPLAEAIRRGDADGVIDLLRAGADHRLRFVEVADGDGAAAPPSTPCSTPSARRTPRPARPPSPRTARAAFDGGGLGADPVRPPPGPFGVATWNELAEAFLAGGDAGTVGDRRLHAGRPLLATRNDPRTGLANGDPGVLVRVGTASRAVFRRGGELVTFDLAELDAVETAYALTVHKSQGSEYDTVAVVHPPADSPLVSRELLYTAVTRTASQLVVVASVASIRRAVLTPTRRVTGLADALRRRRRPVTPCSIRALEAAGVAFTVHEFEHTPEARATSGGTAADGPRARPRSGVQDARRRRRRRPRRGDRAGQLPAVAEGDGGALGAKRAELCDRRLPSGRPATSSVGSARSGNASASPR